LKTIADGTLEHVKHLAVQIGSRPIGSPANLAAADYISGVFRQSGLSIERQEIPCPDWAAEQTSLDLTANCWKPRRTHFLPPVISAETVAVCALGSSIAEISGKIPVFYGDLAQGELATKGGIYISERDGRILQILDETKPAGIITINPTLHAHWRLIEDFDLDIPSVTISAYSGLKLLKSPGEVVQMKILAHRSPGSTAM
jgi:hypothetical protein